MKAIKLLYRFILRFRYPVSLPEDIATALGVELSNDLTFNEFVDFLSCPHCSPSRLTKFMKRDLAEAAFKNALRVDRFPRKTLFAYYFEEGWLEFCLSFDDRHRLRRVYVQHRQITSDEGIEILLREIA